jgi:hypothetical protein
MAETGILSDPHRIELIDGEIIDMPATRHRQPARRNHKQACSPLHPRVE